jgi:hypothetical protein
MAWMRGKGDLEQEVLFKLDAGSCRLRVELPSEFRQTDGLAAQSVYVARNVVQNYLDLKLGNFVPRSAAAGRIVYRQKPFSVVYPDFEVRLQLDAELILTSDGCEKLHKFLHAALLRANAALLLMLSEHLEQERLLTDAELESLFTFVDEATIKEGDLLAALPYAA